MADRLGKDVEFMVLKREDFLGGKERKLLWFGNLPGVEHKWPTYQYALCLLVTSP